jgi:hypothetical protein
LRNETSLARHGPIPFAPNKNFCSCPAFVVSSRFLSPWIIAAWNVTPSLDILRTQHVISRSHMSVCIVFNLTFLTSNLLKTCVKVTA